MSPVVCPTTADAVCCERDIWGGCCKAAVKSRFLAAAGTVTRFASGLAGHRGVADMDPCVRAGRELTGVIGVTLVAGTVAGEGGAFDKRGFYDRALNRGARN